MVYAQLVIGPAGSGKSTYCPTLHQHCSSVGRSIHIVNLDPAAEIFYYPVAMDIRELVSVDDDMEELGLGPNGGLLYSMEHLEDNLDEWLTEELDNFLDDDCLVFDCPVHDRCDKVSLEWFNLKYHMSISSPKWTLLRKKKDIEDYLNPEPQFLLSELNRRMAPQFAKLNKSLIELVDEYSMVSFVPLDLTEEESIIYVLAQIDTCIQYGEDADVKIKDVDSEDEED